MFRLILLTSCFFTSLSASAGQIKTGDSCMDRVIAQHDRNLDACGNSNKSLDEFKACEDKAENDFNVLADYCLDLRAQEDAYLAASEAERKANASKLQRGQACSDDSQCALGLICGSVRWAGHIRECIRGNR